MGFFMSRPIDTHGWSHRESHWTIYEVGLFVARPMGCFTRYPVDTVVHGKYHRIFLDHTKTPM